MTKLTFALIFFGLAVTSFGQGYIILNDGQKIKFTKFTEEPNKLLVKEPGKKAKTEIKAGDIKGYYLDNEEVLYYAKSVADSLAPKNYQFFKRIECGKINLYVRTVTEVSPMGRFDIAYLYLEKANRFERIYSTDNKAAKNKKDKIEVVKSFVADDEKLIKTIIGDDFKFVPDSLQKLVGTYNLRHHLKEEEIGDEKNFGSLVLYRIGKDLTSSLASRIKYSKTSEADFQFSICDSVYTLKNYDWIEVRLPADRHLRLCFSDANKQCGIISVNPYFPTRFEVKLNKNSKKFFVESKEIEANFEIERLKELKQERKSGK